MPRFIVTNGSYFEPLSYEELVKPVAVAQEAQNNAEEAYATLGMEASALGQYISDNPGDVKAKALYDSYITKLNTLQDNLWKNGYNAQTRQDLASARAGYAKDITRLMSAVKSRQERSKEYWDMRHKYPDLIVGADPASSGLDEYLDNDTYGSDWFSYSGSQFVKEVGADAQARAQEYRRNKEFDKSVPGYITRVAEQGFTNEEVDAAIAAVRDGSYVNLKDGPVKILADTLAGHIAATGAVRGVNISPEQYDRFFDYGREGLAAGIFKPDVKDFEDKVWENNQRWNIWKQQHDYTATPPSDEEETQAYGVPSFAQQLRRNKYDDVQSTVGGGKIAQPFESRIIDTPEGKITVNTEREASKTIYGGEYRDSVLKSYGIDIAHQANDFLRTTDGYQYGKAHTQAGDVDTRSTNLSRSKKKELGLDANKPAIGIEVYHNGEWQLHTGWTKDATDKLNKYNERMKYIAEKNPDLSIAGSGASKWWDKKVKHKVDIAVDPKEANQIRKKSPELAGIPDDIILDIFEMQGRLSDDTPAILMNESIPQALRDQYGRSLYNGWNRNLSQLKNNEGKHSKYAYYKVNPDNTTYSETGTTDITDILGNSTNGYNAGDLSEIYAYPTDIMQGMVRFTGTKGGAYATSPESFGGILPEAVEALRPIVDNLMKPILHPEEVAKMSYREQEEWTRMYYALFDQSYNRNDVVIPVVQDILWSPYYKDGLYGDIVTLINQVISGDRDFRGLFHMKMQGATSNNAEPLM